MHKVAYGSGIEMVTSLSSMSGLFSSYSMFTSHPLPVSFGQQLTEKKIIHEFRVYTVVHKPRGVQSKETKCNLVLIDSSDKTKIFHTLCLLTSMINNSEKSLHQFLSLTVYCDKCNLFNI